MIKNFTVFIIIGVISTTVLAQSDKQISEIQTIYKETNEKIAECESNGQYSSTFLTELVVNKNNGSYPAVGVFKTVFKFYYTYGDREKNPYPNRLLKITVRSDFSNRKEYSEFLFDQQGNLIFYFEKNDEEKERRFYFDSERVIKLLLDEKPENLSKRIKYKTAGLILREKEKLFRIFQNSVN